MLAKIKHLLIWWFARRVQKYCLKTQCYECPFKNNIDGDCIFNSLPCQWNPDECK